MARSITEIKASIMNDISNNPVLLELNSTSNVAIYSLIAYVISVAIWTLEKLFDIHSNEIDEKIKLQKRGTINEYRNLSLSFQFGFHLLLNSDQFDNNGFTDEQIENSKIVKYCSVKESFESARLQIKIASETNGQLSNLNQTQINAFTNYMQQVKWAGVKLSIINQPADVVALNMQVFRDPLVIDSNGVDILTQTKTVELAIQQYLRELDFNGELIVNDLVKFLRNVRGVNNVYISSISSLAYNENQFVNIQTSKIPDAGYFVIQNFNNISYVV